MEGSLIDLALSLIKLLVFRISDARPGVELFWLRPQGSSPAARDVIDPLIFEKGVEETLAESECLRARLGLDSSFFWFGVVGVLDARKNIPLIVDALRGIEEEATTQFGLALLGPWEDSRAFFSSEEALKGASFPVVKVADRLTNQEMNASVGTLDCVVMAYSTHAPNSTTAKAAALGVNVAVAGSPTFRRFASALTGHPGVDLNESDLKTELLSCMSRPRPDPAALSGAHGLTEPLLAAVPTQSMRGR